jgi:hypothetical protein
LNRIVLVLHHRYLPPFTIIGVIWRHHLYSQTKLILFGLNLFFIHLPQANIIFAWHGCPAEHLQNVLRDGPRALRFTDGGYFSTGSYTAFELDYASRYALLKPAANGDCTVILFAVFLSSAYIVTHRDYHPDDPSTPLHLRGVSRFYSPDPQHAVALMPRYNAHFIPVKYFGKVHPVTGKPLIVDVDFQAAPEQDATGHELVLQVNSIALSIAFF